MYPLSVRMEFSDNIHYFTGHDVRTGGLHELNVAATSAAVYCAIG